MNGLNDTEFRVLDELYFVTTHHELLELTNLDEETLNETLLELATRGLVNQMMYNDALNDFEKLEYPERSSFSRSGFVASRQGLLIHNRRS